MLKLYWITLAAYWLRFFLFLSVMSAVIYTIRVNCEIAYAVSSVDSLHGSTTFARIVVQ